MSFFPHILKFACSDIFFHHVNFPGVIFQHGSTKSLTLRVNSKLHGFDTELLIVGSLWKENTQTWNHIDGTQKSEDEWNDFKSWGWWCKSSSSWSYILERRASGEWIAQCVNRPTPQPSVGGSRPTLINATFIHSSNRKIKIHFRGDMHWVLVDSLVCRRSDFESQSWWT